MSEMPILNASDAAYLESRNLATPSQNGKRSIRRSLLTSDDPVASVDSGIGMGEFVEIPTDLWSVQTLEYLGYDSPTAHTIWQDWLIETVYDKGTLFQFAASYIKYNQVSDTTANDNGQWASVFNACGINLDTRNRIMHPEHEDVRLTRSAKHWVVDTFEIRYLLLRRAQQNSHSRTSRRSQTIPPAGSSSNLSSRGNRMMSSGGSFEDVPVPSLGAVHISVQAANLPEIPGHVTLYRGDTESRIHVVLSTGKIDMTSMIDANPSDFSGHRHGDTMYFSTSYWVAQKYANYLKHRQNIGTIVIIRMVLPNNWIERMPKHVFTFGDDWKHVVFNSRKSVAILNLPYGFSSISSKSILIGPILKTHVAGIEQMSSIDQITDRNLMKHPETQELGMQYAIRAMKMEDVQDVAVTDIVSSMNCGS